MSKLKIYQPNEIGEELSNEDLEPLYQAMVGLPMAIEINLKSGMKIGLVHAELPLICSWKDVCSSLTAKKD